MRWKCAVVSGVLVSVLVVPARAGQESPQPASETVAPVLRVEQSRIDLGTVRAGEVAEAVFTLHNHGDVPVKILKAKPS